MKRSRVYVSLFVLLTVSCVNTVMASNTISVLKYVINKSDKPAKVIDHERRANKPFVVGKDNIDFWLPWVTHPSKDRSKTVQKGILDVKNSKTKYYAELTVGDDKGSKSYYLVHGATRPEMMEKDKDLQSAAGMINLRPIVKGEDREVLALVGPDWKIKEVIVSQGKRFGGTFPEVALFISKLGEVTMAFNPKGGKVEALDVDIPVGKDTGTKRVARTGRTSQRQKAVRTPRGQRSGREAVTEKPASRSERRTSRAVRAPKEELPMIGADKRTWSPNALIVPEKKEEPQMVGTDKSSWAPVQPAQESTQKKTDLGELSRSERRIARRRAAAAKN